MTIKFIPPERHRDYIGALTSVLSAAAGAYTLNPFSTSAQASNIWKAFKGVETATPENLAWVWLNATITHAANEFLAFIARENQLMPQARDGAVGAFLKAAIPEEITAKFNDGALRSPVTHEAFQPAREAVISFVLALTRITRFNEKTNQKERYAREFDRCLNRASAYVFSAHYDRLKPLEAAVIGPASEAMRREAAWARHYDWIHRKVDTEPVFSPDGTETPPLKPLYLRPRAYWHELLREDDEAEDKPRYRAHLGNLHQTLEDWLGTDSAKGMDALRLIAGGPGSGKSSFAKVFASETILRESHRVIFIELQYMPKIGGTLEEEIGKHLQTLPHGGAGFPGDAFEWAKSERSPLLLIFDGLDELSFQESERAGLTRNFVSNVQEMLRRQNSQGTWVRVIILGRYAAFSADMYKAPNQTHFLMNMAPIRALEEGDLELPLQNSSDGRRRDCEIRPLSFYAYDLTCDQRLLYWQNWCRARRVEAEPPEAITYDDLLDLNAEPLLLHLLIVSDFCGERWREAAENRNLVYEDILRKVYRRDKDQAKPKAAWGEAQFFALLEALGLAAWHGNGRAGKEAAFNDLRDLHARPVFNSAEATSAHGTMPSLPSLESLLLLTNARRAYVSEPGFEFIHKSFGEYLAARGLVSAATRLHKRHAPEGTKDYANSLALNWAELVRDAALTPEVIRFLYDETWRRGSSSKSNAEDLRFVKRTLEYILNWVQQHGFPLHKMEAIDDFRELETCQRCAEASMLAVASAIACASSSPEEHVTIEWNADGAFRFLERLHATYHGRNNRILSKIDLSGANLSGADLGSTEFSGANLSGADLRRANLIGANLFRADLSEAKLSGANLFRADLSEAKLSGANLFRVDFSEAKLSGADLSGADLSGANLSGADLRRADLSGADLSGADLRRADLSGADLKSADLANCIFAAMFVRSADFSFTNLSTAQVKSIFGVKQGFGRTILPEGLKPPKLWHVAQKAEEDTAELQQAFYDAAEAWRAKQRNE
ncbi:pentapeptide repeat-containing protein [Rhodobacter lacus]|uniref:Pentapeptide repeat-containing protein n=1 Tax=Rhodobacter lacus TaxID=1641972 RepID=A0ABW5ACY3_9RHOB